MNETINIVEFILALISFLWSISTTRNSKPTYAMQLAKLGGVKNPKIKLFYDDKEIKNILSLRVALWNAGKQEIRKEDIPLEAAGPGISLPQSCEVLDWSAKTTTGDNTGKLTLKNNRLSINFDFLNKNDAFLAEILFTLNNTNSTPNFHLTGQLKGYKLIKGDTNNHTKLDIVMMSISFSILIYFLSKVVYATYIALSNSQAHWPYLLTASLTLGVLSAAHFKFKILSIPKKIPDKYFKFLEYGDSD